MSCRAVLAESIAAALIGGVVTLVGVIASKSRNRAVMELNWINEDGANSGTINPERSVSERAEYKRQFPKQHILPAVLLIIVLNCFEVLYGLQLAAS